jgi:hypothetical protein
MREIAKEEIPQVIEWLETLGYRVTPPPTPAAVDDVHRLGEAFGRIAQTLDPPDFTKRRRGLLTIPAEDFLPSRPPRMQKDQEFTHPMTGERWRVTDVGIRTFLAVKLSDPKVVADPSWLNGPPYAVVESVWDEADYSVLREVPGIDWT